MKNVDVEAAVATATAIPVRKLMSRAEKLTHWAGLVRAYQGPLGLYHMLEHPVRVAEHPRMNVMCDQTALGVAGRDPVLTEQGFTDKTVTGAMKFFDLSLEDLHAFSCNCGGEIGNSDQANRIERIAGGGSMISRAVNALRP